MTARILVDSVTHLPIFNPSTSKVITVRGSIFNGRVGKFYSRFLSDGKENWNKSTVWGYPTALEFGPGVIYVAINRNRIEAHDHTGALLWSRDVEANIIRVGPDGSIYAAGDILTKMTLNGTTVWTYDIGSDAEGLAVDKYGNVYVTSSKYTKDQDGDIANVRKINSSGVKQWDHGGWCDSENSQIFVDKEDCAIAQVDRYIWKFDEDGNADTIGYGDCILLDNNNDVIVFDDTVINKLSGVDGSLIWDYDVGGQMEYEYYEIYEERPLAIDADNNVYVASIQGIDEDSTTGWLRKLSSGGIRLWTRSASSSSANRGREVVYRAPNKIFACRQPSSADDFVIEALNANTGVLIWYQSDVGYLEFLRVAHIFLYAFDFINGEHPFVAGEIINIVGAPTETAVVRTWIVTSGSWITSDAAGKVWLSSCSIDFITNLQATDLLEDSDDVEICHASSIVRIEKLG